MSQEDKKAVFFGEKHAKDSMFWEKQNMFPIIYALIIN